MQVLGINNNDRRISLGMKQLQTNPWETITQRYHVGSKIHGRVRNLTDFGAFVEVEEGVDGLVHVSDITWSKKVKHPKDVLKKDQEVDAVVTGIDTVGQRMSLSIKDLTPSAWEAFVATHRTGDIVRGKISRFAGFGVFVQLGEELEGLCHISELSDERVNKPEDVVSIGQEMDFKILRIENDVQKIGLSARAVGKEAEPQVDTKMYSTEAKSGMASLGELMNLKRGGTSGETETAEEPRLSKKERKAQKARDREADADSYIDDAADSDLPSDVVSDETNDESANETETSNVEKSVEETGTQAEGDKTLEVSTQENAPETSNESEESVTASQNTDENVSETNKENKSETENDNSNTSDTLPEENNAVAENPTASPKDEAVSDNTSGAEATDSNVTEDAAAASENVAQSDSSAGNSEKNESNDKVESSEAAAEAEEKSAKG